MRLAHVLGASRLAASVLPLSTAYALCGAFGWERGVSYSWKQAPVLVFVARLANDQVIMRGHTNGHVFNVLAYGITAMLILLTAALLLALALGLGG
jgi:Mn2+/Fe2+ NRAMP family transporter